MLLIAQRTCKSERTRLLNQIQALNTTAPVALRERIGEGNGRKLATRLAKMRTRSEREPASEQLILTSHCVTSPTAPKSSPPKPAPTSTSSPS